MVNNEKKVNNSICMYVCRLSVWLSFSW